MFQLDKYKVLYIISSLKRCGPVNQLYGTIKYLDRTQFEPMVLTLFRESDDSRITDFYDLNVRTYCLNVTKNNSFYRSKLIIRNIVDKINPDLIHSHGFRPDLYTYKYLHKYKHCNTVHNYSYEDYVMAYGKFIGKVMADKHIKIFSKMDLPIACSHAIANNLKKHLNKDIYTIQNGIDNEKFFPVDLQTKLKLREKLNLDKSKRIFIYSGVLTLRKNPILIIDAFNKANISNNSELLLLGDGHLRKECEKVAEKGVHVLGEVNNVIDYLRSSDVFISASKSEGLPMAVLEGLAVGLPVILSDISSHMELVEENKDIGDVFGLSFIDDLIKCLKMYSVINIDNKIKAARKVIERKFSANVMSELYEKSYLRLIKSTRYSS